jgi:ribosome assembly protein YihI (activator of Der GTPase)
MFRMGRRNQSGRSASGVGMQTQTILSRNSIRSRCRWLVGLTIGGLVFGGFRPGGEGWRAGRLAVAQTPGGDNAAGTPQRLDPERVRRLMRQVQAGETLSPEDQAYLDDARRQIRQRVAGQKQPAQSATNRVSQNPADYRDLVPLTDLSGTYKGEDGGLYGGGHNEPPAAHWAAYLKESQKIRPLDARGEPSDSGKIGLVTIGFSNTSLESADFKEAADADARKSSQVVVVNGAIGGRAAVMWAYDGAECLPKTEQEHLDREMDVLRMPKEDRRGSKDTWPTVSTRLREASLTSNQVQVAWMKHVDARPAPLGEFPKHARALEQDMADVVLIAKRRFPNLRVVFFSSRTFGGWSSPTSGSPEPYAYETAFAVRWLVQSQVRGEASLNFDPVRGEVRAPLLLWGPYLWACGDTPRKVDGFVWTQTDVRADDHLHPSAAGCRKVTAALLKLFETDPGARRWFVRSPDAESVLKSPAPPPGTNVSRASAQAPAGQLARLDFDRVRQLMRRRQSGEALTPEEQSYAQRARQAMQKQNAGQPLTDEEKAFVEQARKGFGQGRPNGPNGRGGPGSPPLPPRESTGLVPLDQMSGKESYKGQDGGLYGGGSNQPPAAHLQAALGESKKIAPLDAEGHPSPQGKIVLLSMGMSNTTMEYSRFKALADGEADKSRSLVVVDGAQGGQDAERWNHSDAAVWSVVRERLKAAGVTAQQVQVVWLKQALMAPARFGDFPKHTGELQGHLLGSLQLARQRFPNLRLAYLSSRTYGGYATTGLNPEPYAYEGAFAVRSLIGEQIQGDARLNFDPAKGEVKAPLLLWGPYLWTDGVTARKSDGLAWRREDCADDGTHPSASSGRDKVAQLLLKFFKSEPTARSWFLK